MLLRENLTKINSLKDVDFDPSIPGYAFEHVPTPLTSGGVGLYINDSLKYAVIEKTFEEAFQALWIEIQFSRKSNIFCGIIYRQHNSPQRFQEYFALTLEKLISSNKSVYIMGDFNINLLHAETSCYAYDFLLSLQSFSFIPTIDKPTRVYNNSATLIDNILTNKVDVKITSGNIISDIMISDDYLQFCVFHTSLENSKSRVNNELLKVSEWRNANKLTLNAKKGKLCHFPSLSAQAGLFGKYQNV